MRRDPVEIAGRLPLCAVVVRPLIFTVRRLDQTPHGLTVKCRYLFMTAPKNTRRDAYLERARRAWEALTPAEAVALRRRFGLDRPHALIEDEALRKLARQLSAVKKRSRR